MLKERLLIALDESESADSKNNFDSARIKEIKEDFSKLRYGFPKSKIKEIRNNLYDIRKSKNLSKSKIKKIKQNLKRIRRKPF